MNREPQPRNDRRNKPWPRFMDYIYEANMIDGTLRFMGSILVFCLLFGTLFWLID